MATIGLGKQQVPPPLTLVILIALTRTEFRYSFIPRINKLRYLSHVIAVF